MPQPLLPERQNPHCNGAGVIPRAGKKLDVTREVIQEFLGGIKIRVDTEIAERTQRPGVAVGLAWTPAGGDVLFIEATKMKGKGEFKITGQIQDAIATHTASDIVLSAVGRGQALFTGVMDNTDVFFKVMRVALGDNRIRQDTMNLIGNPVRVQSRDEVPAENDASQE